MTERTAPSAFLTPRVRKETILFATDMLAAAGCMAAALLVRFRGDVPPEHALPYLAALPFLLGFRVFTAYAFGLYDFRNRLTVTDHVFGGLAAAATGEALGYLFLVVLVLYYAPTLHLSRLVALIDMALLAAWFVASRTIALAVLKRSGYRVRVLLLGPAAPCDVLAEELRAHAPDLMTVGDPVASNGVSSPIDDMRHAVETGVDQLILVEPGPDQRELGMILGISDRNRVEVYLYPPLDHSLLTNMHVASIAGVPLLSLRPALAQSPYQFVKRAMDIAVAVVLGAVLAPFALAAAVAVKLDSPGPALFSQERVGLRGRRFRLYKLRTMVADAEARSGPMLSSPGDPRVTRVGKALRRLRLDEVPQLWNVLRGDMSLVGPRPERPEFVARFEQENPLYERRSLVRPGLTGLAQVHGRYDTDYTHKLRYDLTYLNSVSLATDLRILAATVRTVVTGRGAR